MKETFKYMLEIAVEVDGDRPDDENLHARITCALSEAIPGVLFDDEECAVFVDFLCFEVAKEQAERDAALYRDLIYQVARQFPDETRHETALKYIRQMEEPSVLAAARSGE